MQLERQSPHKGVGPDSDRGNDAPGLDPRTVGQHDRARGGLLDADSQAKLDAAVPHPIEDTLGKLVIEGGKHAGEDVDRDHFQFRGRDHRIGAKGGAEELVGLGRDLHPRVTGAGDHEGQAPLSFCGVGRHAGCLEHVDQVITQVDEVADRLGLQRVFGQARESGEVGDRTQCNHQVVGLQCHFVALAVEAQRDPPVHRVDRLDLARVDRDTGKDLAQGDEHVLCLQDAGDDLRHQSVPDFDVLPADHRDVDLVARPLLLDQLAGAADAGVTATEDQDSLAVHDQRARCSAFRAAK